MRKKSQVWVLLAGGLGNQLFQYAFASEIAKSNNSKLMLDTSHANIIQSGLGIEEFKLDGVYLNRPKVYKKIASKLFKIELKTLPNKYIKKNVIETPVFSDFSELYSTNCYYTGHFQSFHVANKFLADNRLLLKSPSKNYLKMKNLYEKNSIAIHVRRGDYRNTGSWGLLSVEYYVKAISSLRLSSKENLYIYSDDVELVYKEFLSNSFFRLITKSDQITFIGTNDSLSPAETLLLMSISERIVIANSTFSLWAAYLNPNSNVLAPREFYRHPEKYQFPRYPNTWIVTDSAWIE